MEQPIDDQGPASEGGGEQVGVIAAAPKKPAVFYRVDATRVSLREYWWGTKSPMVLLALLLLKVFRLRLPSSPDDPCVDSLAPFEVDAGGMPADVLTHMGKASSDLETLGFHSPVYHDIDDAFNATRTYLASYSHPTVPVVARLHMRVWSATAPAKVRFWCEYITAFKDGGYLWTMSSKADLMAPPSCRVVRGTGLQPQPLWMKHEPELKAEWPRRTAIPCTTPEETLAICTRMHEEVLAFQVKRGVFRPLTRQESARVASTEHIRVQAAAGGLKYPDVLAAIDRLQNKKTSWKQWLLLLALSLAVFLMLGFAKQSTLQMLALVPVLLFHELGHYVTMRAFGYRNLRMFFIPGFGAAVTGRAFNVPGWQKVIVSLMGPLPGIILGIIVGLCGMVWHKPWAINAGLLLASLNGFNLLPVMPLDGGQIVRTVLFSRNTVLDVIFRSLAAVVLLGMYFLTQSVVMLMIAIAIFMGVPAMLRSAKAVRELRREGVPPSSPDSQTIPPEVAERIIDKLKGTAKVPVNNSILAQQTLDVFEMLNTRAPGWRGSAGLLSLHAVAFLAAAAFSAIFVLWSRGPIGEMARAGANAPEHAIDVSSIRRAPPELPPGSLGQRVIVVPVEKPAEAKKTYESVHARLGKGESCVLVGDTVFIGLGEGDSAARKKWFEELSPKHPATFVCGKHTRATVTVSCLAPDQKTAEAIETELREYFRLPLAGGLIAPWTPGEKWTPDHAAARRIYTSLLEAEGTVWDDAEAKRLSDAMRAARRAGEDAEWESLLAQRKKFFEQAKEKKQREVIDAAGPGAAREFAEAYVEAHKRIPIGEWYTKGFKELAPRLGAAAGQDRTWASSGQVTRTVTVVQLRYLGLEDPGAGLEGVVRWLQSKGCRTFKYDVFDETAYGGDEQGDDEE
jgi:Zn-dependent protease